MWLCCLPSRGSDRWLGDDSMDPFAGGWDLSWLERLRAVFRRAPAIQLPTKDARRYRPVPPDDMYTSVHVDPLAFEAGEHPLDEPGDELQDADADSASYTLSKPRNLTSGRSSSTPSLVSGSTAPSSADIDRMHEAALFEEVREEPQGKRTGWLDLFF
jgi:hypothetical protein